MKFCILIKFCLLINLAFVVNCDDSQEKVTEWIIIKWWFLIKNKIDFIFYFCSLLFKPKFEKPSVSGDYYFLETFEIDTIGTQWIQSKAKKDGVDETLAKYDGLWSIEPSIDSVLDGDKGLVLKSKAKHHAISSKILRPFQFSNEKPLIIQ